MLVVSCAAQDLLCVARTLPVHLVATKADETSGPGGGGKSPCSFLPVWLGGRKGQAGGGGTNKIVFRVGKCDLDSP